jgi:hypothetical protein
VDNLGSFARLVTAIRPWLGQLVVVGGWAHRLHRFHPLANPPSHPPLTTRDTDLAFSPDAPLAGDVRTANDLFSQVTDTIREAARIPQDRQLTAENVQRACEYGLGEILGTA